MKARWSDTLLAYVRFPPIADMSDGRQKPQVLNRLFSILRKPRAAPRDGLVYVSDEETGPMRSASAGSVVSIPGRGPPWIVVDHEPASVILARWPGRLWRVKVLEAATERDQRHVGGSPLPHARYTRCISVAVEAEEDAAVLFGVHGASVVRILDAASRLTRPDADALARSRHPGAPVAHDRAWRAWLRQQSMADEYDRSLDGALSLGRERWRSPINEGFSVLYDAVFNRAEAVDGDAATQVEDDEVLLIDPWDGAARVLGDAALALGAPELMNDRDRACLLSGWLAVFSHR